MTRQIFRTLQKLKPHTFFQFVLLVLMLFFLQILGYIILRNATVALRGKHSSLLAGLGRISLETWVSQGHVWLAADSHGVLVLLPRFPVLNLLVTSFIFICASHEVKYLNSKS